MSVVRTSTGTLQRSDDEEYSVAGLEKIAGADTYFYPLVSGVQEVAPAGTVYDPETEALVARFTTPPTTQRKGQIDAFFKTPEIKPHLSELDFLHIYAGADSQAARRNWLADIFNATAVSGPTFTADRGFTGDGAASYLQTGFNPSTAGGKYALNSATLGVFVLTENNALYTDIGVGAASFAFIRSRDVGSMRAFTNEGVGSVAAVGSSIGLSAWSRTAANALKLYKDGLAVATDNKASSSVPNAALTVLARSGNAQFSANQVAAAFGGAMLSDAGHLVISNAIRAYLQAVGAIV